MKGSSHIRPHSDSGASWPKLAGAVSAASYRHLALWWHSVTLQEIHNIDPASVEPQGRVDKYGDAPCSGAAAMRGRLHVQQCKGQEFASFCGIVMLNARTQIAHDCTWLISVFPQKCFPSQATSQGAACEIERIASQAQVSSAEILSQETNTRVGNSCSFPGLLLCTELLGPGHELRCGPSIANVILCPAPHLHATLYKCVQFVS